MNNQKETLEKKHYTSIEKTGLSANEHNLSKILFEMQIYNDKIIKRYDLRLLIGKALTDGIKTIDRVTICKFIDLLLNCGYIKQNPTSHLIYTKEHQFTPTTKPHNDTRYIFQREKIDDMQKQFYQKRIDFEKQKGNSIYTHKNLTLDSFKNEDCQSCSKTQEEEKSNN